MNKQQLTSSLWQYVAELRPYIRQHVQILVQDYRGERWYILHDQSGDKFTRFNAAAYDVIGRLNGDYSMQEIMYLVNKSRGDDELLEAEDLLNILAQLQRAEVLRDGLPLGKQDVLNRYYQSQNTKQSVINNPLAIRIPLFDPDRLLNYLAPLARLAFSATGLWLWAFTLLIGLVLAFMNMQAIVDSVSAKTLSPSELFSFWLIYPIIKIFHELGHGMAVKAGGGEAHETGITLLLFMPVPYINASASWAFRDKRRRALVGVAGILVELFLAALGLFIWLLTEPGIVHQVAFNTMLIGGVSTLLFNGNPLLRYDGYYVLSDLIEIPNLASRSSQYYRYLMQTYLLGVKGLRSPINAQGESAWFLFYGLASPVYRLLVLIGIALYLPNEFFVIGVILASWAIFKQILKPILQTLHFLVTSPRLEARRVRAFSSLGLIVIVVISLLQIPVSLTTKAEGVIWFDDNGQLLSYSDSFVEKVLVASGTDVEAGEVLIQLTDKTLVTKQKVLEARLRELRVKQLLERNKSRVRGAMVSDEINAVTAELNQVNDQVSKLQIISHVKGRFILHDPYHLSGQFVHKGDILGYVIQDKQPIVRTVVKQEYADLLHSKPGVIEVKLPGQMESTFEGILIREVPAGSLTLPSIALGALGDGAISVDLRDETGLTATENVFQLDIALPVGTKVTGIGGRAYVRFDHGSESLWGQWVRSLKRLFLRYVLPLTTYY
jgi:putative peptide zinc metalloprotease protein